MKRILLSFIDVILLFTVVVIALLARASNKAGAGEGIIESRHRYAIVTLRYQHHVKLHQEGDYGTRVLVRRDPLSAADRPVWQVALLGPARLPPGATPPPASTPAPKLGPVQLRSDTKEQPAVESVEEREGGSKPAFPLVFANDWTSVLLD